MFISTASARECAQTHQFLAALSTEIWLNQRTIVRSFARIYQLDGLLVGVGVGLRSRCSVSERLPSPGFQVFLSEQSKKI